MRVEEIKQLLSKEIAESKENTFCQKRVTYEKNEDIYVESLIEVLKNLFKRWATERQDKELRYIDIWSMQLSVLTETYEYTIRGYDESYYGDDKYIEEIWKSSLNEKLIAEDKQRFEKEIMSKLIRAKKYDVKDFLNEYIYTTYMKPIPLELHGLEKRMDQLQKYANEIGTGNIRLEYGEMMEQSTYMLEIKPC